MKIPAIIEDNPVVAGGVLLVAVAALWLATRGATQTGKDIGGGVVNLTFGAVEGAGGAVVNHMGNPDENPLYSTGSWIGTHLYDWTH